MADSGSLGEKRPWELLVASIIAAHMAFLNLATLVGSFTRLIKEPRSSLSMLYVLLGLAMAAIAFATAYWTFTRSRRSIAGYCVLIVLMASLMALYPQLSDSTLIGFVEVTFATLGVVAYVVPLILLLRVRATLRP